MKMTHRRKDGTQVRVKKQIRGDKLTMVVSETSPKGEQSKREKVLDMPVHRKGEKKDNRERTKFVQSAIEAELYGTRAPAAPAKPAESAKGASQ